jgi:hypothetical protein
MMATISENRIFISPSIIEGFSANGREDSYVTLAMNAPRAPYRERVQSGREKRLTMIMALQNILARPNRTRVFLHRPARTHVHDARISQARWVAHGVGFANATVLKAISNATGIKGFIGVASLLSASGNDRARPSFPERPIPKP